MNAMILISVLLTFVSTVFSQNCSLDVSREDSPFIITLKKTFPQYDVDKNQSFHFDKGDYFYVVCPKGTYSDFISDTGDRVSCRNGTNLYSLHLKKEMDFTDVSCKSPEVTTVNKTKQKCANDTGTIYEIGFMVGTELLTMITVCFDEAKLNQIYCKYDKIYNDSVTPSLQLPNGDNYYQSFVCNETACGWSDSGSIYKDTNVDDFYDNQEEIFKNLGISNVNSSLLRFPLTTVNLWHLNTVNDGQEIRKVPYYDYINVVPVWDSELLDVLFYVLETTVGGNVGSTMYAGTLGVATLPNDDGAQTEIYLNDGKVPVPKWLWVDLDKAEEVLFYYNHPISEERAVAIAEICSNHFYVTASVFRCSYDSVIEPQLKSLVVELK